MNYYIDEIKKGINDNVHWMKNKITEAFQEHIFFTIFIISFALNFLIECIIRGSLIKGIYMLIANPYVFLCNVVIILITLSLCFFVKNRMFFVALLSTIWFILGVIDKILISNRVTPFTGVDFLLIDNAIPMIKKYFKVWHIALTVLGIILIIAALIYFYVKAPKKREKVNYIKSGLGIFFIVIFYAGMINLAIGSKLIPKQFGNLRNAYEDYGFVYCFTNSIVNTGVKKPSDYSDKTIKDITDNRGEAKKVKKKPNIIFVQLESFFDLKELKTVELSSDPTPNYTKYMKKYPSGYLNVPVVGAGTVNTEFEIMTGMNLEDFGPGEYPFKTVLTKNSCESICYNLKDYGYTSHAVHNNTATFYGRNKVFCNLGYNTFTSSEYMDATETNKVGWLKDKYLVKYIIDSMKSTKNQDFVYAISVQGHGSYPTELDEEYPIKVKAVNEEYDEEDKLNQIEYYASQTNEMDSFVKKLIKAVKKVKEDTVIVFYGDHIPSLGIKSEDLKNKNVYQTPYFIWSNFKNQYKGGEIEAFQLEAKILKELGMDSGDINSYNQKHLNDKVRLNEKYLDGLHTLEYDMLYGDRLAKLGANPYKPTEVKLGIKDIIIKSVSPLNDDDGNVMVYGKNFTRASNVYVEENKMETEYLDSNTLIAKCPELKENDVVKIGQIDAEGSLIDETDVFVYQSEDKDYKKDSTKSKKAKKKKSKSKNK